MPSSAQNEYIRVYAKEGRSAENDCNVLATLARGIENGTLFDIIFGIKSYGEYRVLCYITTTRKVTYVDYVSITTIDVPMTSKQYEGLSAIQLEVDRIEGEVIDAIPRLEITAGYLADKTNGYQICSPDGYRYKATANENDEIASIERSTDKTQEEDYTKIDWNTAQKLIGIKLD